MFLTFMIYSLTYTLLCIWFSLMKDLNTTQGEGEVASSPYTLVTGDMKTIEYKRNIKVDKVNELHVLLNVTVFINNSA